MYEVKDERCFQHPVIKVITIKNSIKKGGFGMKKDQIKTVTNNQAAQGQIIGQTPRSTDIKESVRRWISIILDERYYLEINNMLWFFIAVTDVYLKDLDMQNLPEPELAGAELLQRTADAIKALNEILAEEKGLTQGLDIPDELAPYQIAKLIQVFFHAFQFSRREIYGDDYMREYMYGDDEDLVLMVYLDKYPYDEDPGICDETGTYIPEFEQMMPRIDPRYEEWLPSSYATHSEVEFWLGVLAKKVKDINILDDELIPIRNGILDCRTKKLIPFSPEYLLTYKYSYNLEYVESENGPMIQDFRDRTVSYTVDEWLDTFRARNSKGGN